MSDETTTTDGQVNPVTPTILDDDLQQHEIDEIMADTDDESQSGVVENTNFTKESAFYKQPMPDSPSPVQSAHNELQDQQGQLHQKIVELAKRLEGVLAKPFDGSQKPADTETRPTNGQSPIVAKLEESTAQSQNTEHVVDHLLTNLEV